MPAMISGNFSVNGVSFAQWFNKTVKPANPAPFPNVVAETTFNTLVADMPLLTGKPQITLNEFIGHFCIIYNETGGTFKPLREYGGIEYMFNAIPKKKLSYNTLSTNRKAGDQLSAWKVISTPADITLWNGTAWPANAPQNVKDAAVNCDFFKYRGWGLNQLTTRGNYMACLQPFVQQDIDKLTTAQFDAILKNNVDLACKVFNKFILQSNKAQQAINDLIAGKFDTYGYLVAGGGAKSYVNKYYLPRVNVLQPLLSAATIVKI